MLRGSRRTAARGGGYAAWVRSGGYIKSLNPVAWFRMADAKTVTGSGLAAWPDVMNGHDLLQGTDASRPPYLEYLGTKYLWLPGVAGNYASSPDSVPASITGDIDIRARVALTDWTPAGSNTLVSKLNTAGQYSYDLLVLVTSGALLARFSTDGTAIKSATSTAAPTVSDGGPLWVRVTRASASGDVIFYTAADSSEEPTSWTKLGDTVSTAAGGLFDGNTDVGIGANTAGGNPSSGKIYRASIYSTIGGATPVVDFNPSDATDSATSFPSSSTGETWTVNSTAPLRAQIVGRTSILFDGVADFLKTAAFTLNQPTTVVIGGLKQVSWAISDAILQGVANTSAAIYTPTTTPSISLYAGSGVAANANLAVGVYGVLGAVFNGASSSLKINNTTPTTGNPGAQNFGAITLGSLGDTTGGWSNIQVSGDIIVFPTAPDAATLTRVMRAVALTTNGAVSL